jgi:glycosyltransferase involved in cell wall biosynthesis
MRIAIIADPLDNQSAGVHTYTRQLVAALREEPGDFEVVLVREKLDPDLQGVEQLVVPNTRLPIGFASFRLFVLVPLLLWWKGVDVVFEPAHFGPWNLPRRIKRVTMIHDLTPLLFPQYHRWHSQMLQRIFLKGILRRTDLILSNSENTTRDLHRVFPFTRQKVATILLGRDPFFFPDPARDKLADFHFERPYFLFVGTVEPRKRVKDLLAAYQLFREQQDREIELVLVGGQGWKTGDIPVQIASHPFVNSIKRLGYVSKASLVQLYSHSLALVYPSEYEGFGLPILEALSCGTNVICADNSSLPEVGGELAYYFPTGDIPALASQLEKISRQTPEVLDRRKAGPEWAGGFSWKSYAQQFLSALVDLCR